ncbi:adhesion G protein-coupled receptor B2 [Trichonephila clavipes]|nr:adhesion G protein-coupled receptor B2 [Trichonephila clavipes]
MIYLGFTPILRENTLGGGQEPPTSLPLTNLTRGLAARKLFNVLPCRESTIHLQTSMSSPGFKPRPNGTARRESVRSDGSAKAGEAGAPGRGRGPLPQAGREPRPGGDQGPHFESGDPTEKVVQATRDGASRSQGGIPDTLSGGGAQEDNLVALHFKYDFWHRTAMAGSDVVQSGRPIFYDFFQHLWPYIGNNTANVVLMVKRLWLIRIDQ